MAKPNHKFCNFSVWDASSFANNVKSSLTLVWLDKNLVEECGEGNQLRLCHNIAPARDRTAGPAENVFCKFDQLLEPHRL